MKKAVVIGGILIAACTAIRQQKAQAPVADNLQFHNLKVLPPNITHDELIATMRGFARSLGTRCNHCHVANPPGSAEEFDYPNDSKPEKNVARTMLRMVRNINGEYISKVNAHGQTVTCFTCHRGHTVPEVAVAQAPPETQP
jgi:photosynthetic reaction center cytochrome c subunit